MKTHVRQSFSDGGKAKKSLGQHFLKSQKIAGDIVDAGDIHTDDVVLEIGPGKGILTEKLLSQAGKVIAVEKDGFLVQYLKERFEKEINSGKLILIEGDILEIRNYLPAEALPTGQAGSAQAGNLEIATPASPSEAGRASYKLVANIPYYITGAIIKKFLSSDHQPEQMVLLIQKEVAERIIARDKKESILSISVKAYGNPRYIKKVPARLFSPPPKVDSAILSIEEVSKNFFKDMDEQKFFEVVKTGFAHKRKLLFKNLKGFLKNRGTEEQRNRETLERIFENCGIPEKTRAEDITLKDWKCLTKHLVKSNA